MSDVLDLKSALEQDRQQVLDLLETTRRLVLEVRAAHLWTTESLSSFNTLLGIGQNISRMLALISPYWDEGNNIFKRPEAVKLYKTAYGLWAALRPVRQKFNEQLDKRRRQRIMGEDYVEVAELTPEEIEKHIEEFTQRHAEMWTLYVDLGEAIAAVPAGLVPNLELPKGPGAPTASAAAAPSAPAASPAAAAPAAAAPAAAAPVSSPAPVGGPTPAASPAPSAGPAAEPQAGNDADGAAHARLTLLPEPGVSGAAPGPVMGSTAPQAIGQHPAQAEMPAAAVEEAEDEARLQPRAQAEQLIATLGGRDAAPEPLYPDSGPQQEQPSGISWPDDGLRHGALETQATAAPQPAPQQAPQQAPQAAPQFGPQSSAQTPQAAQPLSSMTPPGGLSPQAGSEQLSSIDRLFGAEARQHDSGLDSEGRPRITFGGDKP